MDPKAQFVFFLLAFICFIVEAFWGFYQAPAPPASRSFRSVNLISLGLAFWVFVLMYSAYKAI